MALRPSIKSNLESFTDDMRVRTDVALRQLAEVKTVIIIGVVALVTIALAVLFA